jgi:diguanylate cyclase (GGDEF)-like protein/PAS domain S-box-containing protein
LVDGRHCSRYLLPAGALVVLLVFVMLTMQYVSGLRSGMKFKEKELLGTEYIRQARNLMESLQHHRAFSSAYLSGDPSVKYLIAEKQSRVEPVFAALADLNAKAGQTLDTGSRLAAIKIKWQSVKDSGLKLSAQDSFDQHDLLLADLIMLVMHVAYTSNLAVDPDADSYDLVHMLAHSLPTLVERMGQIRGLGTSILVRKRISETETAQINARQALVNDMVPRINDNIGKVLGRNASLKEAVGRLPQDLTEATLNVQDLVKNHVLASDYALAPGVFYDRATAPIEAGFGLFDVAASALEKNLTSRNEQLARDLNFGLLAAVAIALMGGYIFSDVYRSTAERDRARGQLRLAARLFECSREAILVTDTNRNVISVNRAFTEITGYAPEEVLGRNPRMWSSGRHDDDFYRNLYAAIHGEGYWQGEIWNKRKNGEIFPEWVSISAIKNDRREIANYLCIATDISGRKKDEERLHLLANYDELTALPNRRMFDQRLDYALAHADRYGKQLAVVYIDLDGFKIINDTLGHAAGDLLLTEAAERLRQCLRKSDAVARFGGDEFVALITESAQQHDVVGVAHKLLEAMACPYLLSGQECRLSASIGISSYPDDGDDAQTLIKNADIAMYRAKAQGKNNFQFYSPQTNVYSYDRLAPESSPRHALEPN